MVQINEPKDIGVPTKWSHNVPDNGNGLYTSLGKQENWDPVAHTWFAQLPKHHPVPTKWSHNVPDNGNGLYTSLGRQENWDPVAHTWF